MLTDYDGFMQRKAFLGDLQWGLWGIVAHPCKGLDAVKVHGTKATTPSAQQAPGEGNKLSILYMAPSKTYVTVYIYIYIYIIYIYISHIYHIYIYI